MGSKTSKTRKELIKQLLLLFRAEWSHRDSKQLHLVCITPRHATLRGTKTISKLQRKLVESNEKIPRINTKLALEIENLGEELRTARRKAQEQRQLEKLKKKFEEEKRELEKRIEEANLAFEKRIEEANQAFEKKLQEEMEKMKSELARFKRQRDEEEEEEGNPPKKSRNE